MAIGVHLSVSSSMGNATCWSQEALSSTESFKPISKWRLLRCVFNCNRIWRDVGREAHNLRVRYTLGLQFTELRSIEVLHQGLASSHPSATTDPLTILNSTEQPPCSLEEHTQQHDRCQQTFCLSRRTMLFSGQGSYKQQYLIPLLVFATPNSGTVRESVLAVVGSVGVWLSFECDQHPTDHVDWGGWETTTPLESLSGSKTACMPVSAATLFQAASILLFQAAYFWLKFREASGSSTRRKRKLSDLDGARWDDDDDGVRSSGVYARPIKDKDGNVVGRKYEPRFKPPRETVGRAVQSFQNLWLGSYKDRRDADIVRQIAAFYYGMPATETVPLADGRPFRIPAMDCQHALSGLEKAKWVSEKARQVFQLYCKRNNTTQCPPSDKNLSVGGEAIQVAADPPPRMSLHSNQTLPQPAEGKEAPEQSITMQEFIGEFLPEALDDVAAEIHQSQDFSIDLAYCQQPLLFVNQGPDCSAPCYTPLHDQSFPQFEPAGQCLPKGSQVESSESGITDLLVKLVSLQQGKIKELEREVERLKSTSQLKYSCQ